MRSLELLLTIFSTFLAASKCLPSLSLFSLTLDFQAFTFAVLQKPCQGNFRKFKDLARVNLGFWKRLLIFEDSKMAAWTCSVLQARKLISYFLNNAAKTCLYGLNISENVEIGYFFQCRTFLHPSGNLHRSYLSAFKYIR